MDCVGIRERISFSLLHLQAAVPEQLSVDPQHLRLNTNHWRNIAEKKKSIPHELKVTKKFALKYFNAHSL